MNDDEWGKVIKCIYDSLDDRAGKDKEVKKCNDPIETQTDFDEPIDEPSNLTKDSKIRPGKSQGLLKMGPARQITYIKASEEPDFLEREKAELISIETKASVGFISRYPPELSFTCVWYISFNFISSCTILELVF